LNTKPLWIPFHELSTVRGDLIAVDAHHWRMLAPRHRILLFRPASDLTESPGECRAPITVNPTSVIEGLKEAASLWRPSIASRLMHLILPRKHSAIEEAEAIQASRLASEILKLNPQPTGRLLWLALDPESPPRPYDWLVMKGYLTLPKGGCPWI